MHPLEDILRQCAQAAPNPWYPSAYAQVAGISRDSLDPPLEQLRLAGLIRLTDWVPVMGQGYVLTPEGVQALENPRTLDRIRQGQVPAVAPYTVQLPRPPARSNTWNRGEAVRAALLGPPAAPVVTFGLILVNVLFFLTGMALAQSWGIPLNAYIKGGDNQGNVRLIQQKIGFLSGKEFYLEGQWWRVLTACFGHIGLLHLGANMVTLYVVGPLLERLWGRGRFLLIYLLSGIGGSCGMLLENPIGGGAGASGALWGIMASLATWTYLNRTALPPSLVAFWRRRLLMALGLNLIVTFGIPNVSKGGHFGGGLVGLIAAVPADWIAVGSTTRRLLGWFGCLAILLVCVGLVALTYSPTRDLFKLYQAAAESTQFYNNQAVPASRSGAGGPRTGRTQEIIAGLADRQAELERLVKSLNRVRFWWNPTLETARDTGISQAEQLISDIAKARRILR